MAALTLRPLPEHYVALGPILKPYGTSGSFIVDRFPEALPDDYLFVEIEGIKVPFAIEELIDRSGQVVLTVSGVDDIGEAERLRGCAAFAAAADDEVPMEEELSYRSLVGWEILRSPEGTPVGVVEGYDDSTANILLRVTDASGSELLLPWVPDWVTSLDEDRRTITLRLPAGLV
jgi:16S rRNA processing protein RimM